MSKKKTTQLKEDEYVLHLSAAELVHLRNLLSVTVPVQDGDQTVSDQLIAISGLQISEDALWSKVVELCKIANVPLGEQAPDYGIFLSEHPVLGIFSKND